MFNMKYTVYSSSGNFCGFNPQLGVCHTEMLVISLAAQEHVGYGIQLGTSDVGDQQAHIIVTHIVNDSPAYR